MFKNTFPLGVANKTTRQEYIHFQLLKYTQIKTTFDVFQSEIFWILY